MVRKTIFAVSNEENRPIFTGCLFEVVDNKLNVVAVDGYRLAIKSNVLNVKANEFSAVIPGKTLNEVNKIILDSFETVKIGISKNQALYPPKHSISLSWPAETDQLKPFGLRLMGMCAEDLMPLRSRRAGRPPPPDAPRRRTPCAPRPCRRCRGSPPGRPPPASRPRTVCRPAPWGRSGCST